MSRPTSPHADLTTADVHAVVHWEHADSAARLAESVAAEDEGKVSHQLVDDTFWVLTDAVPTWKQLDGGGGGAYNHVPLDGSEPGMVVGFTGDGTAADLVGDSVLDMDTIVYQSAGHYNGVSDTFSASTSQLIGTTGDQDHKVSIASPVSFGGMVYRTTGSENTPYFMVSSTQTSSFNYGVAMVSGLYSVRFGAHTSTGMRSSEYAWQHFLVTSPASRLSFKFYLNGKLAFTSGAVTPGTVGAGDSLKIGNVDAVNGDMVARFSDLFVADLEYDADQCRTAAENAFGHVLP